MPTYIESLKLRYGYDTPILLKDLSVNKEDNSSIRKILSDAVRHNKISRAMEGVYYFSTETPWGTKSVLLSAAVAYSMYIRDNNGYYTGMSFENDMGLSSQVPNIRELITNNTASRKRTVSICNNKYIIRKPRTKITAGNISIMPWLDYITYASDRELCKNHDRIREILVADIDLTKELLSFYPSKTSKKIIQEGLL